ncbi:MAG: hydroxyacid dehydrogenase [Alphaproteobacteria bacterium]|nr:hydroxyacid dehydrogenase [Alphaproteobacteria bacterium]
MGRVLRWGRSAYETDDDLAREAADARALGLSWRVETRRDVPPADLDTADVLVVTSKVKVTADVVAAFGGALVVATTSGVDHVDLAACARRGVRVARSPLARRDAVVDHALASLIALMRCLPDQVDAAAAGRWTRGDLPALAPRGLHGATVAVVGYGVIGRRMAAVLDALGARVVAVDPHVEATEHPRLPLHDALSQADAVTLHCALTPSSRDLVDAGALARLPAHAVVVNTARGEVLDVPAAVRAVRSGALRGLSVDVFAREPWPDLVDGDHPHVWFTPHAAGFTHDLGARVADSVGAALRAWVAGATLPFEVVPSAAR